MQFRYDINGLRAIAVLAVILFHFNIQPFNGGFVGVDIFFVISGYLMTSIIIKQTVNNNFSLINFYANRAKRIIPALLFLCICLSLFGFFYFDDNNYRGLLKTIKKTLFFISNTEFAKNSDYFDNSSQENWLLHTWSLSVEWQFYLIYPLLILLLKRYLSYIKIKWVLLLVALFSFIFANYYVYSNPNESFYLIYTRAWELIAGGLVFCFQLNEKNRYKTILFYTGLLSIFISIFIYSAQTAWPSYLTLLPVLGSVLILYANQNNIILNNIVFQYIGKISYSLYLWHWPIAVFLFLSNRIQSLTYSFIGIGASFVLAAFSYHIIERFFLKSKYKNSLVLTKYILIVIIGSILSSALSSYVKRNDRPLLLETFVFENIDVVSHCDEETIKYLKTCSFGSGDVSAIVIGDSHAISSITTIANANHNGKTLLISRPACMVTSNAKYLDKERTEICNIFNEKIITEVKKHKNIPIFIINRFAIYADFNGIDQNYLIIDNTTEDSYTKIFLKNYKDKITQLSKNNPIYIVEPIPEMDTNVMKSVQFQKLFFKKMELSVPKKDYIERQHVFFDFFKNSKALNNVFLLNSSKYLCDESYCYGEKDGFPLYMDDNHLSPKGSDLLKPMFQEVFK